MKKTILSILAVAFAMSAFAQKNVHLTIKHKLGSSPFAFNQAATNNLGKNLNIERIDYYLSGFTIIHDGGMNTVVPAGTYILAKGNSNLVAGLGNYNVTNVEGIKFHIGVDPANNNLDPAQWLAPHPLAPQAPSMHWGWSAGFRFVAIEGKAGTALNTTYQMHGLGNSNYFQQTVMVAGSVNGNDITINLDADYVQALKGIDVSQGPIDHGVDLTDLKVLQNFRDFVFSAGTGFPVVVNNIERQINLAIFPNPSAGNVRLKLDNNSNHLITSASIYDVSGKQINEVPLTNATEADVNFEAKGIYFVQLKSYGINLITKKVVIQ